MRAMGGMRRGRHRDAVAAGTGLVIAIAIAACASPAPSAPAAGPSTPPPVASPTASAATGPSPSPTASPRPTTPASPAATPSPMPSSPAAEIDRVVPLGVPRRALVRAEAAVEGFGSLWIPVGGSPRGWVVRLDPEFGDEVVRIRVGEAPDSVAVTGGAVWVANTSGDGSRHYAGQDTLSRIDPRTNRVVQTIPLPVGGPIAATRDAVWVHGFDDRLRRVDAVTGRVTAARRVDGFPLAGCGDLWASRLVGGAGPEVTVLTTIDPRTGRALRAAGLRASVFAGPSRVDGRCVVAWTGAVGPTNVEVVSAEDGVQPTGVTIPHRVRILDGELWATIDERTVRPFHADGSPAGEPVRLPDEAMEDGDGVFVAVNGRAWVIAGRKAYRLGSVDRLVGRPETVPSLRPFPGVVVLRAGERRIDPDGSGGCTEVYRHGGVVTSDQCGPTTLPVGAAPVRVRAGQELRLVAPDGFRFSMTASGGNGWRVVVATVGSLRGSRDKSDMGIPARLGRVVASGTGPARVLTFRAPERPGEYLVELDAPLQRGVLTWRGNRAYWRVSVAG